MTVEAKRRLPIASQFLLPIELTTELQLLIALKNGGNTPENRRRAVEIMATGKLDQKTQSALVRPVDKGWRELGEESGDSKNPSSVIVPLDELETGDLFKKEKTI